MFHMKRKAKSKRKDDSTGTVFFILIYEAEEGEEPEEARGKLRQTGVNLAGSRFQDRRE